MPGVERLRQEPHSRQDRTTLQGILRDQGQQEQITYQGGFVDIDDVNVLPQGRKTFSDIDILAEDIASKNLINPPLVARLTLDGARDYLDTINTIWQTEFGTDDLVSVDEDGQDKYYILIAGERRFRACRRLEEEACQDHVQDDGEGCFTDHFPNGLEVRISNNIPPIEAIFRQASENTYESIPPDEEARYYDQLMRVIRDEYPDYSLAQFARDVGRSEGKVRDAFRFCRLPTQIQDHVSQGFVPYGIAVEISRLIEANADQGDIDYYVSAALGGRFTVSQMSEIVSGHLRNLSIGQESLFSMEDQVGLREGNVKRIVEREMVGAVWANIYYLQRIAKLFEQGHLRREDSPFSTASPVRVYRSLISTLEDLHPHLESFVHKDEHARMFEIISRQGEVADILLEDSPYTIS